MPSGDRGLLLPSELWPQEQELCAKAAQGAVLDLRSRRSGEDDTVRGREWGPQRRIRAQVLFQLLTGQGPRLAEHVEAVRLRGAQIVGRLNLGYQTLQCSLDLTHCYLRHQLSLSKADAPNVSLRGSYLRSRLAARGLRVSRTLNLSDGFRCDGGVVLRDAQIGTELSCNDAVIGSPGGTALGAGQLIVAGHAFMYRTRFEGEVSLLGARIGGELSLLEAVLHNPGGTALAANKLEAGRSVWLVQAECAGEVSLLGARIGGELNCFQAKLTNPGGNALFADVVDVAGDMFLTDARCSGEVRLNGARIGRALNLNRGVFDNPRSTAIAGNELVVVASMFLNGARCSGEVRLSGAHIGGQLTCEQTVFANPDGVAVGLGRATVAKEVCMRPASLDGRLELGRARVGAWQDAKETWPEQITLGGFVYDSIDATDATFKDRLQSWLPRNGYLPQPYEQLAGVYRQDGNERASRAVAVGKQRVMRARHRRWWIRWPSLSWSALLRWTIGYGYRPTLALVPLVLLVVGGTTLFTFASRFPDQLHPAKPGTSEQPAFDAFRYTMDLLLPVVNFKQRDSFIADGWAAWASFGFTFSGWLLAAIFVAGLSGVFNRG